MTDPNEDKFYCWRCNHMRPIDEKEKSLSGQYENLLAVRYESCGSAEEKARNIDTRHKITDNYAITGVTSC